MRVWDKTFKCVEDSIEGIASAAEGCAHDVAAFEQPIALVPHRNGLAPG